MSRDITKIQNFQKKSAGSPLGWCGTRLLRYLAVGGWHVGWQLPIGSWQLAIGDVTWPLAVGLRQVTLMTSLSYEKKFIKYIQMNKLFDGLSIRDQMYLGDVLYNTLEYDLKKRLTAKQCLELPYFDIIRDI